VRVPSIISPVIRPPSRTAISTVARLQKNLPMARRMRAGCLATRNIASGGMMASACVVESSNRARDWKMTSRQDNTSRYLPLNTRRSCTRPTCTDTGMEYTRHESQRRKASCPVPFAIYVFFSPLFRNSAETHRETMRRFLNLFRWAAI
jgi:hypothetical protein